MTASLLSNDAIEPRSGLRVISSKPPLRKLARGKIILEDPVMRTLEEIVLRVARTSINVLVLGETGVGKNVIAAMIHDLSERANKPFVGLNCAALPEPLLESELFGHERGAYTGAVASKPGMLEVANGGTLFLDEIGELSPALQAKLLRVVETLEVTRLGSLKPRSVDIRFVAATNHDIENDVRLARFRKDLYYRLNSVTLTVPPLRERPSEIEPLAHLFLESACTRFAISDVRFSSAALAALSAHPWPGNVRELKNAVERAVLFVNALRIIEPSDLGLALSNAEFDSSGAGSSSVTRVSELPSSLDAERECIVRALGRCGGNQSRAAKALGMSRRTLVRRLTKLGLSRPRERTVHALPNTPARETKP